MVGKDSLIQPIWKSHSFQKHPKAKTVIQLHPEAAVNVPFQALMGQGFTRFNFKEQKGCKVGQRQGMTETCGHRDQLCAQLAGDLTYKRYRQIGYINVADNP